MPTSDATPELIVQNAAEWERWLDRQHASSPGVRLVLAKKGVEVPTSLSRDQALDAALAYGWIDGQTGKRDESTWTVRFTPRRPRSQWSKRNVGIVERLISSGRMQPAGLAEVERAKADGRWAAAYEGPATIAVPDDLASALALNPEAAAMFDRLSSQNRFAVLYRVTTPKRPETRHRRIEEFVEMLARGETVYPQRG